MESLEKELSSWPTLQESPSPSTKEERYLIKFLANLTEYQDANKMTPSNIAIVLGPNLLWPQTEGNITEMMATVSLQIVAIIEPLIQHADWFFPGDIEFNLTGNYGSPVHVNHNANYNSMPSPDMDHADHKHSDQTRRPLSVATDNMMLEFYKKDGHETYGLLKRNMLFFLPACLPNCLSSPLLMVFVLLDKLGCISVFPPTSMGVRVMDTSWVARRGPSIVRKASSTPPAMQPPAPPCELAATPQSPIPEQSLDISATPSLTPTSFGFPPGAERASTLKTKELSLVSGQKGSPACSHTTPGGGTAQQPPGPTLQLSTEQSPHTLRKVSKKLTPLPAKGPYGQSGGMSDPSTGQPSPASLSPTPPSTPSPYGLSYPPGYSLSSGPLSPAAAPSLSSPPSLTSTLTKSRPAPKPRQRPTLPPPQPPTSSASGSSPQSTEHTLLDDISPGESMSTGNQRVEVGHRLVVWEIAGITSRAYLAHLDIPSIHVEVGATLHLDPSGQVQRHPVPGKISSEEDSESTAL
ncbi:hypothetical protein Chor_012029 [Crotalus horridus]